VALPKLHPDFADLLRAFADADVRYLVIGGYAVGFHDRPRTTKDLDLLLADTAENVARACKALESFAAPRSVIDILARATADEIVWMGTPPLRVDLLKSAPGIDFETAYSGRHTVQIEGVRVDVIGLEHLIAAKKAAGRDQDRLDARRLERLLRK
jgi:predicted nucleotidyltransferase